MTITEQLLREALKELLDECEQGIATSPLTRSQARAALTAPAAEVPEQYTRLRGGVPEGLKSRVLSPGSITVTTESGYTCTLWKSGHGGVESLAYQMADMLRKSLTAAHPTKDTP